jgi:hypothetical protein
MESIPNVLSGWSLANASNCDRRAWFPKKFSSFVDLSSLSSSLSVVVELSFSLLTSVGTSIGFSFSVDKSFASVTSSVVVIDGSS